MIVKHMIWDLIILWGKRRIFWVVGSNPNCSRVCLLDRFFIEYRPRELDKLSGESDGPSSEWAVELIFRNIDSLQCLTTDFVMLDPFPLCFFVLSSSTQ